LLIEAMGETGLINFDNLRDTESKFVILGHSEVRKRGESNETINTKLRAVVRTRMTAVLCIGEDERDAEGKYLDDIKHMLMECLDRVVGRECEKIVLAYEPVWAIGGSVSATVAEAQEVIIFIRRVLIDLFGISDAKKIKVLYGGSVDGNNASLYTRESGADGLLVGRGCMDADVFAEIINSVNK
jgi:triosephosphate isomerase